MPAAEQQPSSADIGIVVSQALRSAAKVAHKHRPDLVRRHRSHVGVEVGDIPEGAAEKTISIRKARADIVRIVGPRA
jgi:hypothetical protein